MSSVPAAAPTPSPGLPALRAAWRAVLAALVFRGACYAVMTAAAVWNELRPAATVPDLAVGSLPYLPWVARTNYLLWLGVYLPLSLGLLWGAPRLFARYTVTAGLVSLVRGGTLLLTGLGPPDPATAGPGLGGRPALDAFLALLSPWQVFAKDAMAAYLTKDLFFSGHTATTFLLALYLWRFPRVRPLALAGHLLVVLSVLFSHLHYGIDVVGGWAIALSVYALREGWPPPRGATLS
jgi:membrane-associated phospholipid phosphatase